MRGVVKFLLDMTLRKTAGSVPIVENESQKINNAFALNPSEFSIELGGVFCFSPTLQRDRFPLTVNRFSV
jgi:hypothetical protein